MAHGSRQDDSSNAAAGRIGSRIIKGAASAAVALSLLTGAAFSGPADIMDDNTSSQITPPPIVLEADDFVNTPVDDEDDAGEEKTSRPGVIARFRQAVYAMPQTVRLLIVTPLWLLGTALMTAVSFLWNVIFASPLGAFIASFAMGFAVLLGLFAATSKMLFPDVPLRRMFSRRNLIILGSVSLVLSVIDAAAPHYWHSYPLAAALIKLAAGGVVIGILSVRTGRFFSKLTGKTPQTA